MISRGPGGRGAAKKDLADGTDFHHRDCGSKVTKDGTYNGWFGYSWSRWKCSGPCGSPGWTKERMERFTEAELAERFFVPTEKSFGDFVLVEKQEGKALYTQLVPFGEAKGLKKAVTGLEPEKRKK